MSALYIAGNGTVVYCTLKLQIFNLPRAANNVLKMTHALLGSALGVLGVHLQIFPVNYAVFFSALGVHVHPLHPLATPTFLSQTIWVHLQPLSRNWPLTN